jgi:ABC-type spermidine/putrescine transport system permease subunit II
MVVSRALSVPPEPTREKSAAVWLTRLGGRLWKIVFICAAIGLMVGPLLVVIIASTSTTRFSVFPPVGFTLKWYVVAMQQEEVRAAALYSLWVAIFSSIASTALALLLALGLEAIDRARFVVRRLHSFFASGSRIVLMLPLMFPLIVMAVALLDFFSQMGWYGSYTLLIAHTLYALPFALTLVEIGLAGASDELRRSALSLGASPWQTIWHVVLPAARVGIGAALGLTFIMSFGEFTLALFLHEPESVTLPIHIYNSLFANPLTPDITAVSGAITIMTVIGMAIVLLAARRMMDGGER